MSVIFAVLSTVAIGTGEFIASGATQRSRANEVTTTMFLGGVVMMIAVVALWPGDPSRSDLIYGAFAGVANGAAILLLYVAYSRGALRSAAPAAAVVMSGVPVVWDLVVSNSSPSLLTAMGLVLGVVAIGLSSYEPGDGERERSTLMLAILAGGVFGVLLILLSYVGDDAGGTPLLVQRCVALVVAATVARATGPRVLPALRRDLAVSLGIGLLATTAVLLFVLALRDGSLSMVSVVGSQYAAVAVLLGVVLRGQRMWWWQGLGLAGASVAVALISIG